MDLIYADSDKNDIGVLNDYSFDLAFGSDENDFELTVNSSNHVCDDDYIVYIEGTEYGGVVDAIEVDTETKTIKYKGRTWHGILNSKCIEPASGQNYYTASGDANTVLDTIITKLSLSGLFSASSSSSGITISSYQFKRYCMGYDGIRDMLQSVGAKLHVEWSDGSVVLSAVEIDSYEDDELDSDHIGLKIQRTYNPVNHMICLGSGTLSNRTVINLYCDADGTISTTQSITGLDEVVYVYDYPNVESSDDLLAEGKKKLKELNGADVVEMNLDSTFSFDIGDIVHAEDITTGIAVERRVIKKIVTINNDRLTVNYKVGE